MAKKDGTKAYQPQITSIITETQASSPETVQFADTLVSVSPLTNYLQIFNDLKTSLNIGNTSTIAGTTICDVSNYKVTPYTDLLTSNINGCIVNNDYKSILTNTGCYSGVQVGASDCLSVNPNGVAINSITGSRTNYLSVNSGYNTCHVINNPDYGLSACSINNSITLLTAGKNFEGITGTGVKFELGYNTNSCAVENNANLFIKSTEFKGMLTGSSWCTEIGLNNDGLYSIKSDYLNLKTTINDYGLKINSGVCINVGTSLLNTDTCFGVLNTKSNDFGSLLHVSNSNVGTIFRNNEFGIHKDFGLGVAHKFLNDDDYFGTTVKLNNLYGDFNNQKSVTNFTPTKELTKIFGQIKENINVEHFGYTYDEVQAGKNITINVYFNIAINNMTGQNAHIGNNYFN